MENLGSDFEHEGIYVVTAFDRDPDHSLDILEQYHIETVGDMLMVLEIASEILNERYPVDPVDLRDALDFFHLASDVKAHDEMQSKLKKLQFTPQGITHFFATLHCNVGAVYYSGIFVEQDYEMAEYHYKLAAEYGSDQASCNLGYVYLYGRNGVTDYDKAFACFALAAALGNSNALYKLGDLYAFGQGCEVNVDLAYKLYRKAKQKLVSTDDYSYADVYKRLGDCYFYGKSVERDYMQALKYYEKAEYGGYIKLQHRDPHVGSLLEKIEKQISACKKEIRESLQSVSE